MDLDDREMDASRMPREVDVSEVYDVCVASAAGTGVASVGLIAVVEALLADGGGDDGQRRLREPRVAFVARTDGMGVTGAYAERLRQRMHAETVRTNITSHPLVRLDAVRRHMRAEGYDSESNEKTVSKRRSVPLRAFEECCVERERHLLRRGGPVRCWEGVVSRISRMSTDEKSRFRLESGDDGVKVEMADGSLLFSRCAIVVSENNELRLPAWYGRALREAIVDGDDAAGNSIMHVADVSIADELRKAQMGERDTDVTIAIVGGGEGAAQYAIAALECGLASRIVIVHRRALVKRDLSLDSGWMGGKFMRPFLESSANEERLGLVRGARRGSICRGTYAKLQELVKSHKVRIIEEVEVTHAERCLSAATGERCMGEGGWRLWLCGSKNKERLTLTGDDARDAEAVSANMPKFLYTVTAPGSENAVGDTGDCMSTFSVDADVVWLATGGAFRVAAGTDNLGTLSGAGGGGTREGVLTRLIHEHPIELCGGYPCLSNDLCWKGIPVYCMGAAATLIGGADDDSSLVLVTHDPQGICRVPLRSTHIFDVPRDFIFIVNPLTLRVESRANLHFQALDPECVFRRTETAQR